MCLLLIAIDVVPGFPLLLLGNRDEFHARASALASVWDFDSAVVGGRDLVAGGSWLALRRNGRFAAVTNLRTDVPASAPRSRGVLVRDFVLDNVAPAVFLDAARANADEYGPFNLVVGGRSGVWALGSTTSEIVQLRAGVHVISNGGIGVHWPKTDRLQQRFSETVESRFDEDDEAGLLDLLLDEVQPRDSELPDTGVGVDLERRLAPIFIRGEKYGTRAATLVVRRADGRIILRERRFGPQAGTLSEMRLQAEPGSGFRETTI